MNQTETESLKVKDVVYWNTNVNDIGEIVAFSEHAVAINWRNAAGKISWVDRRDMDQIHKATITSGNTPTDHEKAEWSRFAKAAYSTGRNSTGHAFSGAAALAKGATMPLAHFDKLQAEYREWLVSGTFRETPSVEIGEESKYKIAARVAMFAELKNWLDAGAESINFGATVDDNGKTFKQLVLEAL